MIDGLGAYINTTIDFPLVSHDQDLSIPMAPIDPEEQDHSGQSILILAMTNSQYLFII